MTSPRSGQITEILGGVYTVETGAGSVEASLRGRLKREARTDDRVVIGDRVTVLEGSGGEYTIESVEPRTSWVSRRTLGGRRGKVVASNLDRLLVCASVAEPAPSPPVIDRMLVMGESGGLACAVILNKVDLVVDRAPVEALADRYTGAGYDVIQTSIHTDEGAAAFHELLCSGSSALVGPSGVGKSSLVNWVEPSVSLRTKEVGRRSKAGRHTTVSSRIIPLECGGRVADTPGFSDVGVGGVAKADLDGCFPDFAPFLGECRFRDCSHVHEPGCAVRQGLEDGLINTDRYDSYLSILDELADGDR